MTIFLFVFAVLLSLRLFGGDEGRQAEAMNVASTMVASLRDEANLPASRGVAFLLGWLDGRCADILLRILLMAQAPVVTATAVVAGSALGAPCPDCGGRGWSARLGRDTTSVLVRHQCGACQGTGNAQKGER